MPLQNKIWIGTSNIVVPGNKDSFPPPYNLKSRLHYYAAIFNSVEINQTFYKLPRPATFERWAGEVSGDFTFSVKLSKDITHSKGLQYDDALVDRFVYAAERLQHKQGCLLVQFPGKISLDHFSEVERLLQQLQEAAGDHPWRTAVEFRNTSWYCGETYDLLNEYKASLVLHDMPASKIMEPVTDAPFVYLRLHGAAGDYRGSYTGSFLKQLAHNIQDFHRQGKDVYIYFNNTIGVAYNNAHTLIHNIRSLS